MKTPIPNSQTTTDSYVVSKHAVQQVDELYLPTQDQECFAQALLTPTKQSPALKGARDLRKKLLRVEID